MGKINPGNKAERTKIAESEGIQGKGDRVLNLINSGLQDVKALADIFNTIDSTLESRKTVDTENAVKLYKAETDTKREQNRHNEEMAKIMQEWKKISDAAVDREMRLLFIKRQIENFQEEYKRYMNLEQEDFLSDTVTKRLGDLRNTIMELTKELNRT